MKDPDVWIAIRGTWTRASWLPIKNQDTAQSVRAVLAEAVVLGAVLVECVEPSRWATECDDWPRLAMTDDVRASLASESVARQRKLERERLDEEARKAHVAAVLEGMRAKAKREEEHQTLSDLDGYWTNTESPDPTREIAARVLVSKVVGEAMRLEKSRARSVASKFITSERLRMEFA